jgi:hypothetical protein
VALIISTAAGTFIAVDSSFIDVMALSYCLGIWACFPYPKEAGLAPLWVAGVARDGDGGNGSDGGGGMYNR